MSAPARPILAGQLLPMPWRALVLVMAMLAMLAAGTAAHAQLPSGDDPEASAIWQKVRASLFEGRSIAPASADTLVLEAPSRAIDAAVVPIVIRTRLPQTPTAFVTRIYLLIDANPSPIAAVFHFTPDSGRADIETRVRVDAYSFVRAVAETSDGRLFMATRYVKASGGCSAPAGTDARAALASMGQMRFRIEGDMAGTAPVMAQLQIQHPNHSGLAMDQSTRQYTPAHFVRRVDISYSERPVLTADVDFSISENPVFRFYFLPRGPGTLQASVIDSQDLRFGATLAQREPRR
jgi:sulfur-oxidizing protein SoxY